MTDGLAHSEAIQKAARWLATAPRHEVQPAAVPALKRRFGLTAQEAVAAIREANLIKARAA
tara:strand:- start:318 stop:500 length:183 start_codon:yes stop_codon:yes gene_type:complete